MLVTTERTWGSLRFAVSHEVFNTSKFWLIFSKNFLEWNSFMRKWQHIKLSYRESLFCQWGLFLHWNRFIVNTSQTLPLVKISDCEERDTFQRDIWYQNPLPYIKSNECLIEYFIWSVTVKQNKYLNSMQTVLPPQTWILLSEIDLEHFTLSVFMKQRI